jgi:hypothetical protein
MQSDLKCRNREKARISNTRTLVDGPNSITSTKSASRASIWLKTSTDGEMTSVFRRSRSPGFSSLRLGCGTGFGSICDDIGGRLFSRPDLIVGSASVDSALSNQSFPSLVMQILFSGRYG